MRVASCEKPRNRLGKFSSVSFKRGSKRNKKKASKQQQHLAALCHRDRTCTSASHMHIDRPSFRSMPQRDARLENPSITTSQRKSWSTATAFFCTIVLSAPYGRCEERHKELRKAFSSTENLHKFGLGFSPFAEDSGAATRVFFLGARRARTTRRISLYTLAHTVTSSIHYFSARAFYCAIAAVASKNQHGLCPINHIKTYVLSFFLQKVNSAGDIVKPNRSACGSEAAVARVCDASSFGRI